MNKTIKVGFCVAYDWYYLENSLPLIYDVSDVICLSLDKDRISWAGKRFEFDEYKFKELIQKIDVDKKVTLYEDDFHLKGLTPMENEVRQRNLMTEQMGKDENSWYIQLDADEYFVDFRSFTIYLQKINIVRPTNICCPWLTLFKQFDGGFLLIPPVNFKQTEFIPIATNLPDYKYGRKNGNFNHYTDFFIIHQSWARTGNEILQKLLNWGHKDDFNIEKYFSLWKSLDNLNYQNIQNFHPIEPSMWAKLEKVEVNSIEELILKFRNNVPFSISKWDLALANSIWFSRGKSILEKFYSL